ncbi:MAG TPA: C69 family dipeptidase, partial [Micrococcaceae bacterium]
IIGMELVRLGLERGSSARGALDIMTALLERYGQWGSGLFGKGPAEGAYDNSYLIADRDDAWVLETSGREWVARQIKSGIYSISNEPSIRSEYDLCSTNLLATAHARGWISPEATFDYAVSHADPGTPLQVSHMRQRRSQSLLESARARGGVGLENAKAVLRDHFEGSFLNGPYFNAARPDFLTLCMHEHTAGFTWGNTAGSVIVDMGQNAEDLTVIWWTPLPPCIGAYIPIFLASQQIPEELQLPAPGAIVQPPEDCGQSPFDPTSYWWRFQNLLDAVKGDRSGTRFAERQRSVRARFGRLEAGWNADVDDLRRPWKVADGERRAHLVDELRSLTSGAVRDADAAVDGFLLEYEPKGRSEPIDPRWAEGNPMRQAI